MVFDLVFILLGSLNQMQILWPFASEMGMMENEGVFSSVYFVEPIHVQLTLSKDNLADEGLDFWMAKVSVEDLILEFFNISDLKLHPIGAPRNVFLFLHQAVGTSTISERW